MPWQSICPSCGARYSLRSWPLSGELLFCVDCNFAAGAIALLPHVRPEPNPKEPQQLKLDL